MDEMRHLEPEIFHWMASESRPGRSIITRTAGLNSGIELQVEEFGGHGADTITTLLTTLRSTLGDQTPL